MRLIVQRVRVRWSAGARGAIEANRRRAIPEAYLLPPLATDEPLVVHDVVASETDDYAAETRTAYGVEALRSVGVRAEIAPDAVVIERLPGAHVYPISPSPRRLFTLSDGQVGRYRANFRFLGPMCEAYWFYENWTLSIAVGSVRPEVFLSAIPEREIDHRVHLYGGHARRSVRPPSE